MRKLLSKLKFLLISFGIPWKDERFLQDLKRWKNVMGLKGTDKEVLSYLLARDKAFRSLFLYRLHGSRFYRGWFRMLYPPLDSLYITTSQIGGGLFIQHGFSTYIAAESIGENCWINQLVNIGYRDSGRSPRIGNNVTVTCGAVVLGDITIGDNAVIGANAVVIKDVEPDAVMGGVPARRLK